MRIGVNTNEGRSRRLASIMVSALLRDINDNDPYVVLVFITCIGASDYMIQVYSSVMRNYDLAFALVLQFLTIETTVVAD